MASPRLIKVGTDCSGMEAPIQAMQNLKVGFAHKFSCDVNPHARATIEANFPHGVMYDDLTKRNNKEAPKVDLYVAGFPCQPFSSAGLQQGFDDSRGRGEIFFYVKDFLAKNKPRVFILENVSGLVKLQGGKYMKAILKELASLRCYNVQWQVLDTKAHGVPHSRRRWYCVGIHKDFDNGKFTFPQPIPCPSIEDFLERRDPKLAHAGLPPRTQTTAKGNVRRALSTLKHKGSDPVKNAWIVDCDSSPARSKSVDGVSPCITVSRGAGHWVTNRGRRMSKEEMMRLQGMNPKNFKVAVSECQLGKQLGNTMSVNVLERLLVRVLPAAKLCRRGDVKDRWETGSALKILKRTRGKGFMAVGAKDKARIAKNAREDKKRRSTASAEGGAARKRART